MGNIPQNKVRLFRMVHNKNLEYILQNGFYTQNSEMIDPNYIGIGDSILINQRYDFKIPIRDYGCLGDYIPFYFAGHSPMLLNIKTGYRGITKRPQEEIVFVVCEVFDIVKHCKKWVFTDGHPKTKITWFYNDLKYLNELNWQTINSQTWNNTDDNPDRMREKQAEFMVHHHVPIKCIKGLIVKNNKQKSEIQQIVTKLDIALPIYIDEKCRYYYP